MKKQYYWYIVFILLLIVGIGYYNRPLHPNGLTDPGEKYFSLPQRTLPSSWNLIKQEYGFDVKSEKFDQLASMDEAIQHYNYKDRTGSNEYRTMNTSGQVEAYNRDTITTLFNSGDNRQIIQYHIDKLASYISGYEIYPPKMDYATAIPPFNGQQAIMRVGSLYSSLLCREGNITQCTDNFEKLFQFSQQMKNSGTLVSLLIGIVEEGIIVDQIKTLSQENSEQYQSLIDMLKQQSYIDADTAIRNTFASEYQLFKNTVDTLPQQLFSYAMYEMVNTVSGGEGKTLEDIVLIVSRFIKIPPTWLFDPLETKYIGRSYYHYALNNSINSGEIIIQDNLKHARSRKNIVGYHLLNALIPRLTGIQQRTIDSETKFQELIKE